MPREQRRLAAIVSAGIENFSRLMGRDESGTLARVKALRAELVDPAIAQHGGRIVKPTGDGLLVEFPSVVDAVSCVVEVQSAMADRGVVTSGAEQIALRIGINLGDIILDGDDIFGDGVNVAARLQELALPGGAAVSDLVYEDIRDRMKVGFVDAGPQALKNIARAVHVWRWHPADIVDAAHGIESALTLPDKPSIAVLPFVNMSGEREQDYFTDGITDDIITELARFHELFVISRNSSFTYKGRPPDVRQVGRELGVRYVLEGSIRKSGKRIRVTGQLVDALSGAHIWAERYDRVLEDIFAVQEELTEAIVRAIAPEIVEAETVKVERKRPENLNAYEIAVRANSKTFDAWTRADKTLRDDAIADAREALRIDPNSVLALGALAFAQWQHLAYSTATDRATAWREAMEATTRLIELDHAHSFGYSVQSLLFVFASDRDRISEAIAAAKRSYELNPHTMAALTSLSFIEIVSGDPESAIGHLLQALRLSPRDPRRQTVFMNLAMACECAGRYREGVDYARAGIAEAPTLAPLHVHLAVNLVGLGDLEAAKAAFDEAKRIAPSQTERSLAGFMFRNKLHQERGTTFLRIAAGLEPPEKAESLR